MIHIPDTIFPKNERGDAICPACQKVLKQCLCPSYDPAQKIIEACVVEIKLDKCARRGKIVTVINNLPTDEKLLKDLARKLKSKTGCGGTFYRGDFGVIEIQGKKVEMITKILRSEGYQIK